MNSKKVSHVTESRKMSSQLPNEEVVSIEEVVIAKLMR